MSLCQYRQLSESQYFYINKRLFAVVTVFWQRGLREESVFVTLSRKRTHTENRAYNTRTFGIEILFLR